MKRRIRTTGRSDGLEKERTIRDAAYAAGFAARKKIATKEKAALRKRMQRQRVDHEMYQRRLLQEIVTLKARLKETQASRVVKVVLPLESYGPLPWSNKPDKVSWANIDGVDRAEQP